MESFLVAVAARTADCALEAAVRSLSPPPTNPVYESRLLPIDARGEAEAVKFEDVLEDALYLPRPWLRAPVATCQPSPPAPRCWLLSRFLALQPLRHPSLDRYAHSGTPHHTRIMFLRYMYRSAV